MTKSDRFTAILVVAWLLLISSVMAVILNYSYSPGRAGVAPEHWPAESGVVLDEKLPTLVLFAHPMCPCTRATIGELEILMSRFPGKLNSQVWFIHPEGVASDWSDSDLCRKAAAIPGVVVHMDVGLVEAKRFKAETSGEVLVYNSDGQRMFQGGITVSRGHSGDNAGRDAVESLLKNLSPGQVNTPVFGCPLFESTCQEGDIACKP